MKQLQGLDASFVALEQPHAPMHIGSILIYDPASAPGGFVRFKDILAFFESRMMLTKTMRQRLVKVPFDLDYPYWIEDPNFDLEYHLRHVALPKPGDWRQLCIQAARIFARPLDLTRPPWEYTVVEGLDNIPGIPKGSFAIITKVHHSAIDGMSGIDLLEATHSLSPDDPAPDLKDDWKPEQKPPVTELLFRSYVNAVTNPVRQVRILAQAVPGIGRYIKGVFDKELSVEESGSAPRTLFNGPISSNRVIEGRTFALNDIKNARILSEGCKINDVFLTIIGGALREYLRDKKDLPDASMRAMVPISVRSSGEKNEMGNQVAAMVAPLGTHIADPAERLRYVHAQTVNSKAITESLGAREMTEMSQSSPALFMALGARLYSRLGLAKRINPVFNTIVTNVPGPPVPLYSAGARLVSMHGLLCLTDGQGIGHVVQSYVDQATIGFTACREMMPDPEYYSQCLQNSFDALIAATEQAAKAAPSRPKVKSKATATRKTTKKTARRKKA